MVDRGVVLDSAVVVAALLVGVVVVVVIVIVIAIVVVAVVVPVAVDDCMKLRWTLSRTRCSLLPLAASVLGESTSVVVGT